MNSMQNTESIMIRSLHLQNYKCFENQLLDFSALNLLSGLNGTGKSSVLQALLLLRQSYQQNLLQTTGLALNGDLVHIGTAKDALFEGAKVDITDNNLLESFGLSDYFFGEKQAVGLGVTFLLDALSVSLRSDPCWFESHLQVRVSQLDDGGEITDVFEPIPHASIIDHINTHLPWINKRLQVNAQSDVHEGLDIWSHREEWFPHLYFCEQVKEQLQALNRGHLILLPILKRLYELESYCHNWLAGPLDHSKIVSKATPESAVTLEMYSLERTFRCHDGVSRVFSWHVRLTPGAWRLYFYPLPEEHKLIIGYVGSHLSTKLHAH